MEAVKLMRGPVGTSIDLTVRRKNVKKPLEFKIIRKIIEVKSVNSEIISKEKNIGYAFAELSKPDECEKAVNEIIKEFGRIDGLVNNAGINDGIGLENGNYEDFLSSIKNNLAHYYKMAQLVLPELKKNKGSIVNIGSKVSSTGQGGSFI